jgi:hypothetical protein
LTPLAHGHIVETPLMSSRLALAAPTALAALIALVVPTLACGGATSAPAPSAARPTPASGPPKPLDTATIPITAAGFTLDAVSAAAFKLSDLHVYQGSRLTFVNNDVSTHDVLSDPPHIHRTAPR